MTFQDYLQEQAKLHPAMQPQDIVKLCYQAAFGAEHLLADVLSAKAFLQREYDHVSAMDGVLYEMISPQVCRVNLAVWKHKGLPLDWLFSMFCATASVSGGSSELFVAYLDMAESLLPELPVTFTVRDWQEYQRRYWGAEHRDHSQIHAIHHSDRYRQEEHPAYRILHAKYVRLFPILEAAGAFRHKDAGKVSSKTCGHPSKPYIIAIDGRAAAGKSTLASLLAETIKAPVIHMDDFFLPPALRTEERRRMPGGNVHYERFCEEVLPHLPCTEPFSYRVFDCSTMEYNTTRLIPASAVRIVEGSYSHHPALGDYADLKVFADVEATEQSRRILHRNGASMAVIFETTWIPMEETYFDTFQIRKQADLLL